MEAWGIEEAFELVPRMRRLSAPLGSPPHSPVESPEKDKELPRPESHAAVGSSALLRRALDVDKEPSPSRRRLFASTLASQRSELGIDSEELDKLDDDEALEQARELLLLSFFSQKPRDVLGHPTRQHLGSFFRAAVAFKACDDKSRSGKLNRFQLRRALAQLGLKVSFTSAFSRQALFVSTTARSGSSPSSREQEVKLARRPRALMMTRARR